METASSPILSSLRFCGGATTTADIASTARFFYHTYAGRLCTNSLIASPRNYYSYGLGRKIKHRLRSDRFIGNASAGNTSDLNLSQEFAVLLEVEGVLMDVYRLGNRQAFNVAFRKLGLDCANWSEPVYLDLVRKSAGDEERMLILYFNRIGWPTSVATSEKGTFMKNVLRGKKNALDELVMSKALSLRPGAEEFIDDACEEGVPVVILTAYGTSGEKAASSIVEKLGTERMSKTKIVGEDEVKQSFYGQLVFGKGASSSLDEQLANEVSKAASAERQRIAEEVASMLKLKVELNNNNSNSLQSIVAALRAGAEYAQVPIQNCVLVAGSQSGVAAAERISMPCVVLRSSSTSRAEFPSAIAVMDGFGGADLTITRLRRKLSL
ncbi:haloacid dehalogenase-like hydrolase domain-containing protein at3g48420 [Phtheirospermum japonicum]|uniref:Haloacid dehalogenase-like hydrolase domain-containing protein at3g48420 n=1 Tax=Phtheirospermum japonicum TaxID=374723 RepID=A0A830BHG0_9LAMI|nr:haloacid dehalogenase-like hydrolase domain-containing protein at3g48420 [Phtheirospermum japonicum]